MNALTQINAANARLPATYDHAKQARSRVYFIATRDRRRVKIGMAGDVHARLSQLQVGCPDKLSLIRVIDGGAPTEAWLHRRFAAKRQSGEWFVFDEAMLTVVPPDELPVRAVHRPRLSLTLREIMDTADAFDVGAGSRAKLLSIIAQSTEDDAQTIIDLLREFIASRRSPKTEEAA